MTCLVWFRTPVMLNAYVIIWNMIYVAAYIWYIFHFFGKDWHCCISEINLELLLPRRVSARVQAKIIFLFMYMYYISTLYYYAFSNCKCYVPVLILIINVVIVLIRRYISDHFLSKLPILLLESHLPWLLYFLFSQTSSLHQQK